jgi:hypothetical protein
MRRFIYFWNTDTLQKRHAMTFAFLSCNRNVHCLTVRPPDQK